MGRDSGHFARRRRRVLARSTIVILASLIVIAASCEPPKPPPPPPPSDPTVHCVPDPPTTPEQYQAAFDGLFATSTGGFTAADGAQPVSLPDGRVLWMFGDTFLASRAADGTPSYRGLANNGFVVQEDECFTPMAEPLPDPATEQWIWPTSGVVDPNGGDEVLRIVGLHMRRTGPGDFNFAIVQMITATFSLPELALIEAPAPLPVPPPSANDPTYGESVTLVPDGSGGSWVYAYGETRQTGILPTANHYVARVPLGQLREEEAWQFWHDDLTIPGDETWVAGDPTMATPLLFDDGVDTEPSVDEGPVAALPVTPPRADGSVLAAAFRLDIGGGPIETWHAPQPQGPFTLLTTPAVQRNTVASRMVANQFAYGGRVLFDILGAPIAVWSVNHFSFDAILADPELYKVWFATPESGSLP